MGPQPDGRTVGIDVPLELRPDDSHEHGVCRFLIYTGGDEGLARFSLKRLRGNRLLTQIPARRPGPVSLEPSASSRERLRNCSASS